MMPSCEDLFAYPFLSQCGIFGDLQEEIGTLQVVMMNGCKKCILEQMVSSQMDSLS